MGFENYLEIYCLVVRSPSRINYNLSEAGNVHCLDWEFKAEFTRNNKKRKNNQEKKKKNKLSKRGKGKGKIE